jgi:rRNA small subunit pseudouridine methyltransferase Nep1
VTLTCLERLCLIRNLQFFPITSKAPHLLQIRLFIKRGNFIRAFCAIRLACLIHCRARSGRRNPTVFACSHKILILVRANCFSSLRGILFLNVNPQSARITRPYCLKRSHLTIHWYQAMLHIVLLECAVELIPPELTALKQIQKHASRRRKKPNEILLDQTYHGQAMTQLEGHEQRGRPDIIFLSLLTLLETPVCKEGLLTIHLHLRDGTIVQVNPEVRLPRNYERFVGLFEQLLLKGQVPVDGTPLLKVLENDLSSLLFEFKGEYKEPLVILTKDGGIQTTISGLDTMLPSNPSFPVVVGIGAFPHGGFSEEISQLFTSHLEFDREVMMAWHVCAEVLWTYSRKVGIIEKRYGMSKGGHH